MRLAHPPKSCKVYTPTSLAEAMVIALGDEPHFRWLEPSHGKGAFLQALALKRISSERIVAVDLDPMPASNDKLAKTIRGVDFLRWASETEERFDRIVGNPPYVAISQLPISLRRVAAEVTDLSSRPIGKGANVWYAFVLASLRLLNPKGSLAFVLPSCAEFADYSKAIRSAVREQFERLEVYRSARPLFPDVQEGSLVVIARTFQSRPFRIVRRRFATPADLIARLSKPTLITGRPCPQRAGFTADGNIGFSSVVNIRLGGVTGDASYFLMNEEKRQQLNLPVAALTPVVSRARQLQSSFIGEADWDRLKQEGSRVWLFNPAESVVQHPAVKKYIRRSVDGCNRSAFKIRNRKPWYRTPLSPTPHAFLSGMSQFGPWLCINEMPGLNATNTLYVVTFRNANRNERYGYALALLTTFVRKQLRHLGRRYADGLVKYEPSALAGLRLPVMKRDGDFRVLYRSAVQALLSGRVKDAMQIADSALA
jgi:adenine-specific DNA-methyltransferase